MTKHTRISTTRRRLLQGAVVGAAGLSAPAILRAQERSLKVGVYGGYFKDSFDEHIFPGFTEATGIQVESIAEPTGEAWLVQLQQAARAKQAPADVSMMAQTAMLKGQDAKLWTALDESKLPNMSNVLDPFVNRYEDGSLAGLGAVSWYITLVTNTEEYPEPPASWDVFWDSANKDRIGLLSLVSNSFLLEVTASTFFGGTEILDTEEGQLQVFEKLAELKSNVRLWYRDEAQFEQSLKSGEIPMGQYYHDVTGLAVADGFPVRSTFPREGGILDSGAWAVTRASTKVEESLEFINYMCLPEVQKQLSLKVGTSPTVSRESTGLSDEEFASVSSSIAPILPRYDLYQEKSDWLNQRWNEMIIG